MTTKYVPTPEMDKHPLSKSYITMDIEFLREYISESIASAKKDLKSKELTTINISAETLNLIFGNGSVVCPDTRPASIMIGFICSKDLVFRWYYKNATWHFGDSIREVKLIIWSRLLLDEFNNASEINRDAI